MRHKRYTNGFTIVELTIVVSAISIIALIGFVSYGVWVGRGYDTAVMADASTLESAITNMSTNHIGGLVVFIDENGDDIDDGYHYTDATATVEPIPTLNAQLGGFSPTRNKGNVIDAMPTSDGREFCIRVYNTRSSQYKTAATAYVVVSNSNVTSGVGTCTHS